MSVRAHDRRQDSALALTPGATCLERAALQKCLDGALDRRIESTSLRVEVEGSALDPRSATIRLFASAVPSSAHDANVSSASADTDRDALAERVFSPGPPRCVDFTQAIALAIALMVRNTEREVHAPTALSEGAATSSREPAPSAPPEASALGPRSLRSQDHVARTRLDAPPRLESRTTALRIAPLDSQPRVRPARASSWRLQAAGALGIQLGPQVSTGVSSDLAYTHSRLSLSLGVLGLFSTPSKLRGTTFRAQTRPLAASLGFGVRVLSGRSFVLRLAVGLLAGRMRTTLRAEEGQRVAPSERSRWFAGKAALELGLPLAPSLQLVLAVGPVWTLRRLGIEARADEGTDVLARHTFPPLGALLVLGLAFERGDSVFRQGSGREGHP